MAGLGLLDSHESTGSPEEHSFLWQVKLENGQWINYDEFNCKAISTAMADGQVKVSARVGQRRYELDLETLEQTNPKTGMKRPIRRTWATWQVKLDNDNWTNYDDRTNRILNFAKQEGRKKSNVHIGGRAYELNLDQLEQVNLRTGKSRPIRQTGPGMDKGHSSCRDLPAQLKGAVPPSCSPPSIMVAASKVSVRQHLLSSSMENSLNKY